MTAVGAFMAERSDKQQLRTRLAKWPSVRLRDLIREAQAGFACGQRDPLGVIQLRMNNVDTRGSFIWSDVLRVPAGAASIERFQLVRDDVVFNNTNSTELVGKSALFKGHDEPIVYSNHFTRLRTVAKVLLPDFLARWLNHQWQQGVFAAICDRWIGQSAVKAEKLLNLYFPLPPLEEQRRIASIVREQMAAVEKARTAAQARLKAIKTLPTSLLRLVFPQPDQPLCAGWRWVRLGQVADRVDYGYTAGAEVDIKAIKFLRITDIQDGKVNWDNVPGCKISNTDEYSKRLEAGDIVFARTGATTGKSYLLSDPPRSVFASYLIRVRTQRELIVPDYLFNFFQSNVYWEQISTGARGGAQAGFNATMLKALRIPLPQLEEQRRIVEMLRIKMAAMEKARAAAEEEISTVNVLPAALLRMAFAGEL